MVTHAAGAFCPVVGALVCGTVLADLGEGDAAPLLGPIAIKALAAQGILR
jgi:hypothetical protein